MRIVTVKGCTCSGEKFPHFSISQADSDKVLRQDLCPLHAPKLSHFGLAAKYAKKPTKQISKTPTKKAKVPKTKVRGKKKKS